ncbi:hypothetical protein V8C35DRAFT_325981 [Trichoderma chlorosporum]
MSLDGQRPATLKFIEITNPVDTIDTEKLKEIRSHVAKRSHRKRLLPGSLTFRQYQPAVSTTPFKAANPENQDNISFAVNSNELKLQKTYIKKNTTSKETKIYIQRFNPRHALVYHRRNPFQTYWRKLNNFENFLLDHYIMYVVDNGYKNWNNGPGCTMEDFLWHMKKNFIPWALTDEDLVMSILMIASYNLSTLCPENNLLHVLRLYYKGKCIKAIQDTAFKEYPVSDTIITLALMLVAEAFMSGNRDEFMLHATGILNLNAKMNKGIHQSPGGCLEYFLFWTVYNPRHGIIN